MSETGTAAGPGDAAVHVRNLRVSIEGYANGYVLLSDGYATPPEPDQTPLREPRPAPVTARELYDDGWMFHGPRFAGVVEIAALAADGIAGTGSGSLRRRPTGRRVQGQ